MARYYTVLNQMVNILWRHECESLAKARHTGQRFRSFNRWLQFLAMLVGQMSARRSMRDLVDNLAAQKQKLYHPGIKKDCIVHHGDTPKPLRHLEYVDPESGTEYSFVTNVFHVPAKTVADRHKERWKIELFFTWIKQNLKIKTFLGASINFERRNLITLFNPPDPLPVVSNQSVLWKYL